MDEQTQDPRDALEVLADSADLYERKNADYGDSWKLVGELLATILQHQGMDELTIPVEANALNSLGLFFRRGDKFTREVNGWFAADELQVNESIAETHNDDVPYAAMHTELAEEAAATDGERPMTREDLTTLQRVAIDRENPQEFLNSLREVKQVHEDRDTPKEVRRFELKLELGEEDLDHAIRKVESVVEGDEDA
jgi:hypothetical protein